MLKKKIALLLAGLLTVTALPCSAFAAEEAANDLPTFTEIVRENLDKNLEQMKNVELPDIYTPNSDMNLTLTLGEAGKGLLSMFLPVDLSPLQDAGLHAAAKVEDDLLGCTLDLLVNGTKILSVLFTYNLETQDYTMAVPDLTETVLGGNYQDVLANLSDEETASRLKDMLTTYFARLKDMTQNEETRALAADNASAFADIFAQVADIVLGYYVNDNTEETTYDIHDISEDVIAASAYINMAGMPSLASDLFTFARDNEDVLALVEKMSQMIPAGEEPFTIDTFQQQIDGILEEIAGEENDFTEEDYLYATIYQNADGKSVAKEFSLFDEGEPAFTFSYGAPSDGDRKAFDLFATAGPDMEFELVGEGIQGGDVLNGDYTFYFGDLALANIEATDVRTDSANSFDGTFSIHAAAPDEDAEDPLGLSGVLSFLASFDVTADIHSTTKSGLFGLSLNSSGSPLVALTSDWDNNKEVSMPEVPEETLDIMSGDEEAAAALFETLDPTPVIANLEQAGLSMEYIESLMDSFMGSEE